MKLDYKILWLDDKIDIIIDEKYVQEIDNYISEQGFNPIIVPVQNEKDFFKNLDDSFDLILTDYHLNEERNQTRNGDTIIKEVRNKYYMTIF
jgi:DNA integrity scanning protein DisA with diadenylate cyclase activity